MTTQTGLAPIARMSHTHVQPIAADDVIVGGLRAPRKRLPPGLVHAARASQPLDKLYALDSYYLHRTELALLHEHLPAIAMQVGIDARVIAPGPRSGAITNAVLDAIVRPSCYVPVDASADVLARAAVRMRVERRGLVVQPVSADPLSRFELPVPDHAYSRTLVMLPGAVIGTLEPDAATGLLAHLGRLAGPRGLLLLGTDSTTDPDVLAGAYDDDHGVMAELQLDLLRHLNRARHAGFDQAAFIHRAVWDEARGRLELHLVSRCNQTVLVSGIPIYLKRGEPIVAEHAYKHAPATLACLLGHAGWHVRRVFTDEERPVRVWLCER